MINEINNIESSVRSRYARASEAVEPELCCPVSYNREYLEVIPQEVIEKDYGCGDPSQYLKPGETVLDLGSGTGKICFIAAQVVGSEGKVIGVDMTDSMLEVARRNAPIVAERIGFSNVEFRKGRIQDLAVDLEELEGKLQDRPVAGVDDLFALEASIAEMRETQPLIADNSVDVVVSNCVLNLVENEDKEKLFKEIFRVLKKGGRAVISDIVSDEPVPENLQRDPELWSGCISGAYTEEGFIEAFERAGFYGISLLKFDQKPWRTVEGIDFRSVTVEAFKGIQDEGFERNQAVIYKGPFKSVCDDDGHVFHRGQRHAVCDKTFNLYKNKPYYSHFEFLEPNETIALAEAEPFDCSRDARREPRETKGQNYKESSETASCQTGGGSPCC